MTEHHELNQLYKQVRFSMLRADRELQLHKQIYRDVMRELKDKGYKQNTNSLEWEKDD